MGLLSKFMSALIGEPYTPNQCLSPPPNRCNSRRRNAAQPPHNRVRRNRLVSLRNPPNRHS